MFLAGMFKPQCAKLHLQPNATIISAKISTRP
jgi:hypothetical protein